MLLNKKVNFLSNISIALTFAGIISVGSCASIESKECTLPEHPLKGKWLIPNAKSQTKKSGDKVPSGSTINVECNEKQYQLDGQSIITCNNGKWSSKVGQCDVLCPPLKNSTNIKFSCTLNNKQTSSCLRPKNGTTALIECEKFYKNVDVNRNPFRICLNGHWSQGIPTCTPVCGNKPKKNFYPWNAAIFYDNGKEFLFRCAATLVNERTVITAAHCIYDSQIEKKFPAAKLKIAVGKSLSDVAAVDDKEAQFSQVEETFVPEDYKLQVRKYAKDIAVIVVRNSFRLNKRVQPICVDWAREFTEEFSYPGTKGLIAGPLVSTFFKNLKVVPEIEVPFLNDSDCYNQLQATKDRPYSLEVFYTYDKLCSGFINSDKVPRCRVDMGVGLVSKNSRNGKYYLTAVASVSPSIHGNVCDNKMFVLFTQMNPFLDFIVPKIKLYQPLEDNPYVQESCGIKSVTGQTLIVGGNNVTKGDYPWQVAIYRINSSKDRKTLICGGSLLSSRVILTAAHCVIDNIKGTIMPKESFVVAVGKYFRDYDHDNDKDAQFSTIKEIFVPSEYQGENQNYLADIALMITVNSFKFSRAVQPICVDWGGKFQRHLLRDESTVNGFVSGWGYTRENSDPSEVLKDIEVPYVDQTKCREGLPVDYDIFLTSDKICSGFLNKSVGVCQGDSGGGLVFRNRIDERYYIIGVVSLSPQSPTGGCDSQQYGLYTMVSKYLQSFILEKYKVYWA